MKATCGFFLAVSTHLMVFSSISSGQLKVECTFVVNGRPWQPIVMAIDGDNPRLQIPIILPDAVNNFSVGGATQMMNVENKNTNENLLQVKGWKETLQDHAISFQQYLRDFLEKHKQALLLGGGVSFYAAVLFHLKYLEVKLARKDLWSKWKEELSSPELFALSDVPLVSDLLLAIQLRYKQFSNNVNAFGPVLAFMQAIDTEQRYLVNYLWWAGWLRTCYVGKLFFLSKSLLEQARERLDRLAFLKGRIESWAMNPYLANQLPTRMPSA